jgi:two-component system, OmpR family, phosphate regulon response regulator PhoB
MTKKILVVEDDLNIRKLLQLNLSMSGYEVVEAADAVQAFHHISQSLPDLILVDWNMPGPSGVSMVRRVRAEFTQRMIPIIMITARDDEQDKVLAFECGVDDYLTKPFKVREMLARIEALLRRSAPTAYSQILDIDGLCLNHEFHQVMVCGTEVVLGPTEYKLLHFLMMHPMRVHSRQQLLNHVWGTTVDLQDRTVDAYVGRLRTQILNAGHHHCIETIRSIGYRFLKRELPSLSTHLGEERRARDRRETPGATENG